MVHEIKLITYELFPLKQQVRKTPGFMGNRDNYVSCYSGTF